MMVKTYTCYLWNRTQKYHGKRFIEQIKDRTECFNDDNFPCKNHNCDKQHVDNWLRIYLLYLHMKTDRIRFTDFVIENALS